MPKTQPITPTAKDAASSPAPGREAHTSAFGIVLALTFCHFLNDVIQAVIPAIYPLLKESFKLNFTQIGLITLTFQMVGSIFQPVVGSYTDKYPKPYSLVFGMGVTWSGVILLALAPTYAVVLLASGLVGLGSAVFHPESSRMARLASGGRHGFAQSLFQVGGNTGTALGPLLAAAIIMPHGQRHILWFGALALAGVITMSKVGRWYQQKLVDAAGRSRPLVKTSESSAGASVAPALCVLLLLMFSKFFYLASMTSYYTFYLMHRFAVSAQQSQLYLFLFLGAGAAGTLLGGLATDRIGRKQVI
jgi:FSR family fosmidomycin resistance protein-like MFS transporter